MFKPVTTKTTREITQTETSWPCPECDFSARTEWEVTSHWCRKHGQTRLVCDEFAFGDDTEIQAERAVKVSSEDELSMYGARFTWDGPGVYVICYSHTNRFEERCTRAFPLDAYERMVREFMDEAIDRLQYLKGWADES